MRTTALLLAISLMGCIAWMFLFSFVVHYATSIPGNQWWRPPVVILSLLSAAVPGSLSVIYATKIAEHKMKGAQMTPIEELRDFIVRNKSVHERMENPEGVERHTRWLAALDALIAERDALKPRDGAEEGRYESPHPNPEGVAQADGRGGDQASRHVSACQRPGVASANIDLQRHYLPAAFSGTNDPQNQSPQGRKGEVRTKELEESMQLAAAIEASEPETRSFGDEAARILAAEVRRLEEDKARLDWLADRNNEVGQVLLPTACVQAHPYDMRAAIDAAMEVVKA